MRVWSPRGISRRMSSRGGWSRCPGAAGLGLTVGVWRRAGLMPSSAVLGLAAWAGLFSVWRGGLGSCGVAAGAGCESSCA